MDFNLLWKSLYFFLPGFAANMAPVLFRWIPWGKKPLSEHWMGSNKTWRGLIAGIVLGTLVFWLQQVAYQFGFRNLAIIDYLDFSLWLGFWMSFGALAGDAVKSYYKRREGISPGKPWLPWDQLDFVIGGIIGACIVYVPSAEVVLLIVLAGPLLHLIVNYAGYLLGLKKNKL